MHVGGGIVGSVFTLQYLEVLKVCVFGIDVELDPTHGHVLYVVLGSVEHLRVADQGKLTKDAVVDLA